MTKLRSLLATFFISTIFFGLNAQETPKYIFYFIGDGMGMGHVLATQTYNRVVLGNTDPILMMQFPVSGVITTFSASSPITDSAAAGTALSTGSKTKNSMLGMNADTVSVESVASQLFKKGYGVGIITSVCPDDATPGAFYAHQPNRRNKYEIDMEAIASGYQFIAGSNFSGLKTRDGKSTGVVEAMAEQGIDYVRGAEAAAASTSERVMMVNTDSINKDNIGYTIDSIAGVLTLPEMTQTCLNHLLKWTPEKFFMMVEGGNIDHAAHANDGGTVIKEILNFNEALQIAYDFYLQHPDETLIIVTADHDTGGMAIGNPAVGYRMNPQYIDYQRISLDRFADECRGILRSRRIYTWDDMKELLSTQLGFWNGVPVNEKQTELLREKFEKTFEQRNSEDLKTLYSNFDEFTDVVFKTFNDVTGIGWVTTSHTGNYVPVYSIGVGSEALYGIHDNTDIPAMIRKVAEL